MHGVLTRGAESSFKSLVFIGGEVVTGERKADPERLVYD
jgi:hypothetical protein